MIGFPALDGRGRKGQNLEHRVLRFRGLPWQKVSGPRPPTGAFHLAIATPPHLAETLQAAVLARRELAAGQIDVWLTDPDAISAEELSGYEALLSSEEHSRWMRFAVPEPRLLHLVARTLLRTTLSRYVGEVAPAEWRFAANAHGRPHVAGPALDRDLRFNLSHTKGLVALAVAEGFDVGADVEDIKRSLDLMRVARGVFAPAELAALERAAPHQRQAMFFAFWTLKEAYIKARGMGLSLDLGGFAFDLSGAHPAVSFNDRCPDDPARWWFRRYSPTASHELAVAAATQEPDVRLIWTTPRADLAGS